MPKDKQTNSLYYQLLILAVLMTDEFCQEIKKYWMYLFVCFLQ